MKAWWLLVAVVPLVVGCTHREVIVEKEGSSEEADEAPPADKDDPQPPQPSAEYIWVKGHWTWAGRWEWVAGHWDVKKDGHTWVDGHWDKRGHRWHWVAGHWAN